MPQRSGVLDFAVAALFVREALRRDVQRGAAETPFGEGYVESGGETAQCVPIVNPAGSDAVAAVGGIIWLAAQGGLLRQHLVEIQPGIQRIARCGTPSQGNAFRPNTSRYTFLLWYPSDSAGR